MTYGEKFREMADDELVSVLWWYSIHAMCSFMEKGGKGVMDYKELKKWIRTEYDPNCKLINAPQEDK